VGLFFPNLTTSLRIDTQKGLGTDLSLEDDFNFEETLAVFYANATIQIKNRSQFVFSYTNIHRNSSVMLNQDVSFQDTTFFVGADLDLRFDMNYYAFTWRYSLFNKANWNAGFSLGLRAAEFIARADAVWNGDEYGAEDSFIAPALLIGLHASGYLTPRLLGRYSLEYFQLNLTEGSVRVLETRASLEYFILKNVGIGAAYSTSSYNVSNFDLNDSFEGRVLLEFNGGNLFLCARF
jgi:hypothetical protein